MDEYEEFYAGKITFSKLEAARLDGNILKRNVINLHEHKFNDIFISKRCFISDVSPAFGTARQTCLQYSQEQEFSD